MLLQGLQGWGVAGLVVAGGAGLGLCSRVAWSLKFTSALFCKVFM